MKKQARKKSGKSEKINKTIPLMELMQKHPEAAEVLFSRGLGCIGCPAAMMETLEQGCLAHGIDPDEVVKEINKKIKKKK